MKKKRSAKQYAVALHELTDGASGKKLDAILKKFVEILARDRKIKKVDNIMKEFEKYAQKKAGITALTVYSARELSKASLDKICHAFGGKTAISTEVTPKILGGVKIRTEDKILDGSLLKQLQILKQKITK